MCSMAAHGTKVNISGPPCLLTPMPELPRLSNHSIQSGDSFMISKTLLVMFIYLAPIMYAQEINHAKLNKALFTRIYEHNCWSSKESHSGLGSTLYKTQYIRKGLPELIKKYEIKTILDAPCGDFNWMKEMDFSIIDLYIGIDIVEALIFENGRKYGNSHRFFFVTDIVNAPLPHADLMLCRDCMQHLPDCNVFNLINNIKRSKIKYLLASNYPERTENHDILDSLYNTTRVAFRNLFLPPFNLPKPLAIIDEGFDKKVLCLWQVSDLPWFDRPQP